MEQCCREDSLGTQHSRTHSEIQGLVQQHTQPSAGVAVVSLAWYAATSLVLGTPTTPPPPLTTPPQGGWEEWQGRGGGEGHDAANEHTHISSGGIGSDRSHMVQFTVHEI